MYYVLRTLPKPSYATKKRETRACAYCEEEFSRDIKYSECPECRREKWLEFQIERGIHPDDLHRKGPIWVGELEKELLYEYQDGKCAICKIPQEDWPRAFAVDHCHQTGQIRGLLCGNCNTGIGMLKDDPEIVKAALAYLQAHKNLPKEHG